MSALGQARKLAGLGPVAAFRAIERKAAPANAGLPRQSGNPSFRRFSAIRFRTAGEKTIACLNFEAVRSG